VFGKKDSGPALAIMSFVSEVGGDEHAVTKGHRYPGNHPAVRANPAYFVPAPEDTGAEPAAMHTGLAEVWQRDEERNPAPATPAPPSPLRDADAVVATRTFFSAKAGLAVNAGARFGKQHPVVREHADAFVPVVNGIRSDRAVVAIDRIANFDRATKTTRVIHAGTWVDRDDPLVQLHPTRFGEVGSNG
jgi:hypothetical protein